ncbi:MAG TPA: lipopolysaccharide biosynthesis protein [Anaerolinea sp.]|nr:lipopolysaccharide biosynthesis protein [Anaerolinea sp.]
MSSLFHRLRAFTGDRLLRRVVRNSSYLFASNAISAVLSIVTANVLGVKSFGELEIITVFVSNVNRLLSFRMGDAVVRYMGEALERGEHERAGAVVKAALLIEALTSLAAYGILALLAPLGAALIAKDTRLVPLFLVYGISILANLVTETSTGVLQVTNHFRSQALITLIQSLAVAAMLALAVVRGGNNEQLIWAVMWAYLTGKLIAGLGPVLVAAYWLPKSVGRDWWRASFALLPPWRELIRFGVSTNISATINVIARDSEGLWVGYFFNATVTGYYKTARAIINLIVMPINPFISTTYPEITRAFVSRQWQRLRDLLGRVSLIAAVWTGGVALGLLLLGRQALFGPVNLFGRTFQLYKAEYLPAYPVLLVLLVGYGAANILFWNRPLLLAQGLADYALKVSFWAMLGKVALSLIFLPAAGYLAEAGFLSLYFVVSVGLMVWRGVEGVRRAEAGLPPAPAGQGAAP